MNNAGTCEHEQGQCDFYNMPFDVKQFISTEIIQNQCTMQSFLQQQPFRLRADATPFAPMKIVPSAQENTNNDKIKMQDIKDNNITTDSQENNDANIKDKHHNNNE